MYYINHRKISAEIENYCEAWEAFRGMCEIAETLGGYVSLVDGNNGEIIADNEEN